MKEYKSATEDPLMSTWHVYNSDLPCHVKVVPDYHDGTSRIPGEIALSYLPKWIKERNREHQSVIDHR
jgi:hypothetical protein